jgi:hypothetical protein
MLPQKPQNESHIHIDVKSESTDIKNILAQFCLERNLALVDHNLDLYLEGDLQSIAAQAPIQHFDIKPSPAETFKTDFSSTNILAQDAFVRLRNELGNVSGYTEAEWLMFKDYKFNKPKPILEDSFFDMVEYGEQVEINTDLRYTEFHWTVPAEYVSQNLSVIQSSGMQSVGFEKNGVKYLVLTTLLPNIQQGKKLAQKIDALQYGDWKLEIKKYHSTDISQWAFRITHLRQKHR